VLADDQKAAIERLQLLGVALQKVVRSGTRWSMERYVVTQQGEGKREDARGAIEDEQPIRRIEVRTERADETVSPGPVYVPLDQPLASLIIAAMEPDSQNSYVANRLIDLEASRLRRVTQKPPSYTIRDFR
jgi:hypothetical protein